MASGSFGRPMIWVPACLNWDSEFPVFSVLDT